MKALGFASYLLSLDGKPLDQHTFKVLNNVNIVSSTLWPILFAGCISVMFKNLAAYLMRDGESLLVSFGRHLLKKCMADIERRRWSD